MAEEIKRALCEFCHARCRVAVRVDDAEFIDVDEDRTDPRVDAIFPPTKACLRLRGAKEWYYHPDRLRFPQKRVGERGEGKWQQISWDQALDEIGDRLWEIRDEYGPEALVHSGGTARTSEQHISRFFNIFGSPNMIGSQNVCYAPCIMMGSSMLGWPPTHRTHLTIPRDASGQFATGCVLLIGINPAQAVHRLWKTFRDAKKEGVKSIVVDPRKTETAELADVWLQIRPNTDAALLMAMINVIIEEGLYNKEFVDKWCYGFDRLVERVKDYPPEKMAEITEVPAEKIREAARTYAQNTPTVTVNGMGAEELTNTVEIIQCKYILSALTASIDVEGGEYLPGPPKCWDGPAVELCELMPEEQKKKQIGVERFKLLSWPGHDLVEPAIKRMWGQESMMHRTAACAHGPSVYRAILTGKPYPVKAMITLAGNPLLNMPNTKLVYKALKELELHVVKDYWMTPSAQLADYVLPTAGWMERPMLLTGWGSDSAIITGEQALPDSVPGEKDCKTDYEFWRGLGIRLGQEEHWPWETLEEAYDYQLSPVGLTLKEFMAQPHGGVYRPPREYKKHEKMGGFGTLTGKVELYSTVLEKLGYDPLPKYEESHENPVSRPDLAKEYPLMLLTGGRIEPYYHSEHRQIDSVRRRRPDPVVQINPRTAKELGVDNGDWVWIETIRGRIRMKAELFEGIKPTVAHAEHGWWFPELPGEEPWLHGLWESNANVLTDDDPDVCAKPTGGWPFKTNLCKIYKAKQY